MSLFTKEIRAAWDRFRFWAWPRSVRRYLIPKPNARIARYPSPGSEPANLEFSQIDYKVAYRDSTHNIRYNVDLHPATKSYLFMSDPLGETLTEKYGCLAQDQIQSQEKVDEAKKKYQEKYGEPAETRVHHDDIGFADQLLSLKSNPEAVGEFISSTFEEVRKANASEAWLNDLNEVYNAQFYYLKTFDMFSDDPVYRQLVIDVEGQLNDIADNRLEIKNFPVFRPDPSYWRILDNSFSEDNHRLVQSSVKNYTGPTDYTPVHISEGEIPPQKIEPTVTVPHETKYL